MAGLPLHFAELSYPQVEELRAATRPIVLLLPVGSIEPHGPHAPLGTDAIISAGMCERVAQRLADDPEIGALILPSIDYGVTRYAREFAGPIHIGEDTLHAMLADICGSAIDQGFRHVVIVNNHFEPEHVQTVHHAIDTVETAKDVTVGYLDLTRRERAARLTDEFRSGECHAGRYETSLVLAEHPEFVNEDRMANLPYVPVTLAAVAAEGGGEFMQMGLEQAYCGSPGQASAGEGEEIFETLTEMLIEQIRALVGGTGGRDGPGLFGRTDESAD